MDNAAFIEVFVQFIIYDGEMQLRGEHHPVGKGIGPKFHAIVFVTAGLPVERQMVCILAGYDGSYQRRRGDTVPEDISRTGSPDYSAVIVFCSIYMHVILRPHPQYVRHFEGKLKLLEQKYAAYHDFTLQMDFSSNDAVFNADILITDWSGIAYEYSFTTLKPTLFINTPMKVMNPDYQEVGVTPFDIEIRNQMGISLEPDQIDSIGTAVHDLLCQENFAPENMKKMRDKYLYNVSHSTEVGAKYIIKRLIEMSGR